MNLLPWREQKNKRDQIYFYYLLSISILALILAFIIFNNSLNKRNNLILSAIHLLQVEDSKIKLDTHSIQQLTSYRQQINFLNLTHQLNREHIIFFQAFQYIIQSMPKDLAFNSFIKKNNQILLVGDVLNPIHLTNFMNLLTTRNSFSKITLNSIKQNESSVTKSPAPNQNLIEENKIATAEFSLLLGLKGLNNES